jgi:iron complex transport system substrate-binding protein
MKFRLLLMLLVAASFSLSALPIAAQEAALADSCVTDYDAAVDYFPDKVTVDYARGFTVDYFNNYKIVTVLTPWQGAADPIQYLLVQCGTPAPEDVEADQVIEIPVQSIVTMSTTFLPHIVDQGLLDHLVAVDTIAYTNSPEVIAKFEAGELAQVSPNFGELNVELLLDLEPDVVMTQRFDDTDQTFPTLQQAGLPVILNADFLDTSPLGQAEWGKYIALFFNTESHAQEAFAGVAERYTQLVELVQDVEDKPTVFANVPFQGSWFMPGGQSYLGQFFAHAGAAYLWADDESTGSIPLDFESVFEQAADADFWLNAGFFWHSRADALAEDERFAEFAAFQNGNVYSNNGHVNASGGSDYFESGVANPDRILADLVSIFHPDLLPDHELYYYKRLPE